MTGILLSEGKICPRKRVHKSCKLHGRFKVICNQITHTSMHPSDHHDGPLKLRQAVFLPEAAGDRLKMRGSREACLSRFSTAADIILQSSMTCDMDALKDCEPHPSSCFH